MYKVSVITPFHNVDMGMFAKCADSMRRQMDRIRFTIY